MGGPIVSETGLVLVVAPPTLPPCNRETRSATTNPQEPRITKRVAK
jgi:hypothetical protein